MTRDALDAFAASLPNVPPRKDLLGRVFDRIDELAGQDSASAPCECEGQSATSGYDFGFDLESPWTSLDIDGVNVRTLHVDAGAERSTVLVRMEPGARYPAHTHAGPEECYIIEGDLSFGGVTMRTGDYVHAATGTVHPELETSAGCLLLVTQSNHNELI